MLVSLIVAADEMRGIGYRGGVPWHLSADLKRFKSLTMGHHVIMGRKTFESIGKALPGRTNVVITRQPEFEADEVIAVESLEDALTVARLAGEHETFIIGGGQVYAQALPHADQIYYTLVHTKAGADTFFPELEEGEWQETLLSEHPADENNDFPYSYYAIRRLQKPLRFPL